MFRLKNIVVWALAITFSIASVFASEVSSSWFTNTQSNFALESVKAVDLNTIKATFNADLATQVESFSFMLNKKDDSLTEISLTWVTISSPRELTIKTETQLDSNLSYLFAALFVSDKDGNTIETWADSAVDLVFELSSNENNTSVENVSLNNSTENTSTNLNSASSEEVVPMTTSAPSESTTEVATTEATNAAPIEEVAKTEDMTKVETWPAEVLAIILALLAWLGLMFLRKKSV